MPGQFELLLFSTDPAFISRAVEAGVDGIIVDWESRGKKLRQADYDTQINEDTIDDLRRVRGCTDAHVLCRINSYGPQTAREIDLAISAGANEIFLPMVRSGAEVEHALAQIDGRCGLGILIETLEAIAIPEKLARLPLSRVYVGLNDLAIARRLPNLFLPLIDGTVERIRPHFQAPFGFGGLTIPEGGAPIPCRLLMGEMARLDARFSFLRRSFHRDMQGRDMRREVPRMRQALKAAARRPPGANGRDSGEFRRAVEAWDGKPVR